MSTNASIKHLIDFLQAGVSPYHTVSHAEEVLHAAGFSPLDFKENWSLSPGQSYYCRTFSGELFAFRLGQQLDLHKGIHIAAGHVDWPCLKVKPAPCFVKKGYLQANV